MSRTSKIETKPALFFANYESKAKVVVNQGGTASGKTWNILDVLFVIGCTERNKIITIVGQDIPNLKKGAYRDAKRIWANDETYQAYYGKPNESDRIFTSATGSMLEFTSYQDEQDAKSGKRDYLFINEANGIPYPIYWQLAIRTKEKIFIDYNPTARFWVHDKLLGRDGVELIISDHRHNEFLTDEQHAEIEGIEDEELFKVYARGRTGRLSGLILTNYDIVERMPRDEERQWTCYGLDFGFTNDPTALVEVCLAHGDLWVDEHIYATGMTNDVIAQAMRAQGITRRHEVVADSAEMKSIAEIKNMGFWVEPTIKGADSVINGLDIVRRYRLHITSRSRGLLDEVKHYKWQTDREGNDTNKPIDMYNHAIDALRYVCLRKCAVRPQGRVRAYYNQLG